MPKTTGGKGYYAVRVGRNPGIYHSWSTCQVEVKGVPNQTYKRFDNPFSAQKYMKGVEYKKRVTPQPIMNSFFKEKTG
jgi:ribonuclease HI